MMDSEPSAKQTIGHSLLESTAQSLALNCAAVAILELIAERFGITQAQVGAQYDLVTERLYRVSESVNASPASGGEPNSIPSVATDAKESPSE